VSYLERGGAFHEAELEGPRQRFEEERELRDRQRALAQLGAVDRRDTSPSRGAVKTGRALSTTGTPVAKSNVSPSVLAIVKLLCEL